MFGLLDGEDTEHLVAEGLGDLAIGTVVNVAVQDGVDTTGILLGGGALAAGHRSRLVSGHDRRTL